MYETYPKSSACPYSSYGQQEKTNWPENGKKTSYPQSLHQTKPTERCKVKSMSRGSGGKNASDWPKSSTKFPTEGRAP